MKTVKITVALAFVFWFLIFSPFTKDYIPFWPGMSAATIILSTFSIVANRRQKDLFQFRAKYFLPGFSSALVLYLIFLAGSLITRLIHFTDSAVGNIYTIKQHAPLWVIGILIFFIIGPAEELFWRGLIQNRFAKRYDDLSALFLTSFLYAFVHIWSFNFMLIITAGICGLFWGSVFYRYKSVWPVIISHAVWDLAILVLLPLK